MVTRSSNRLIRTLERDTKAKLQERANRIQVVRGEILQQAVAALDFVYFPETALLSAAVETIAGETVNVALVGGEGVFGAFEACGSRQSFARLDVQISGAVLRIPAGHYRDVFEDSTTLRREIHRYVETSVVEARQLVACNALHTVEARLARALLDAHDKADGAALTLTQDALSQLLGVQRTTVASAISSSQRLGLLRSGRRAVELIDIPGLEQAACSCRATLAFARREIEAAQAEVCEA